MERVEPLPKDPCQTLSEILLRKEKLDLIKAELDSIRAQQKVALKELYESKEQLESDVKQLRLFTIAVEQIEAQKEKVQAQTARLQDKMKTLEKLTDQVSAKVAEVYIAADAIILCDDLDAKTSEVTRLCENGEKCLKESQTARSTESC